MRQVSEGLSAEEQQRTGLLQEEMCECEEGSLQLWNVRVQVQVHRDLLQREVRECVV